MKPFRHIVVPLDGSELGERALTPAIEIAEAMQKLLPAAEQTENPVSLVLLRAATGPTLATADPFVYDAMLNASMEEADGYLRQLVEGLAKTNIKLDLESAPGPAAEAIVNYTEEHAADLVVLSSHGRTGSSRWVYGSVAEKVLHHAPCAVMVIRAQAATDIYHGRPIVVPLDGSPLAEMALSPAMNVATGGAPVILVRIVSPPEPVAEGLVMHGAPSAEQRGMVHQQAQEEAQAYLQKVAAGLSGAEVTTETVVHAGDVADAIIDFAAAHNAGLIVMSSHGRSGISRWLHGSVAEKVLRGADCATMIFRSQSA